MADSKPVLVAGAGPVGMVAAAELLRRGVPVTVLEAGAEATKEQRAFNGRLQAQFRDSLAGHGMQVNEVADKAAWRRGVLPMYESFRGQIGADIIRDALAAVQ